MKIKISKITNQFVNRHLCSSSPLVGNLSFKEGLRTGRNDRDRSNGIILIANFILLLILLSSCGYRMIGSTPLPFHSVTIKQVRNNTYEPRLEEKMHNALSKEFINQGIEVRGTGGDVELDVTVTNFQTDAVAAVDEMVKEQSIILQVDIKLTDHEKVTEFKSMQSPIRITFQSTGTVTEAAAFKDRATDKACSEIAKEMVGRIILVYAK